MSEARSRRLKSFVSVFATFPPLSASLHLSPPLSSTVASAVALQKEGDDIWAIKFSRERRRQSRSGKLKVAQKDSFQRRRHLDEMITGCVSLRFLDVQARWEEA